MSVLKDTRVPVHRGIIPVAIDGTAEHGVQGVHVKKADGAMLDVKCDASAITCAGKRNSPISRAARSASTKLCSKMDPLRR